MYPCALGIFLRVLNFFEITVCPSAPHPILDAFITLCCSILYWLISMVFWLCLVTTIQMDVAWPQVVISMFLAFLTVFLYCGCSGNSSASQEESYIASGQGVDQSIDVEEHNPEEDEGSPMQSTRA
eukprot:gnl/MRDRNA2_/MRDRNA2_284802_c0_seq1.p1 gnl/MRDRNA2_/MRDRNA2_284802_c0~~gnl/MRDRNA2_/MRDRNA2_284802_c0_seq1.p1  ORF type:complete len:147 (+),score=13.43 gnl/MRDRNA2_/MRDRNA2_284802_c0_seq1:66-443(+)